MKTKILSIMLLTGIFTCLSCNKNITPSGTSDEKPLNITVFIDLSDRLIKPNPSQMERDTAIVGYIAERFLQKTKEDGIQESNNRIKVLFYPEPQGAAMDKCADDLIVDVQKCKEGSERKNKVKGVKEAFLNSLEQVYTQAIKDNQFPGCDIWGFFTDKKVDSQCISENHRNILVILTDGYILDERTMEQKGDTSNYISSKILNNPNAVLRAGRKGLENLEVGILEVNPVQPSHLQKMKQMLQQWLMDMGVKEENITIEETKLIPYTKEVIDRFL